MQYTTMLFLTGLEEERKRQLLQLLSNGPPLKRSMGRKHAKDFARSTPPLALLGPSLVRHSQSLPSKCGNQRPSRRPRDLSKSALNGRLPESMAYCQKLITSIPLALDEA